MTGLVIVVKGTPITQGSKVANRSRPGVRDDNAKVLKPWRAKVTRHARDAARYHDTFTGPVRVTIRFCFDRPKTHYRTGRNAHLLKDDAPRFPTYKKDLDKLQRACFDSLTDAEVWTDDGLAVEVRARKLYAGESEYALEHAGVLVLIEPLDEVTPIASPAPDAHTSAEPPAPPAIPPAGESDDHRPASAGEAHTTQEALPL